MRSLRTILIAIICTVLSLPVSVSAKQEVQHIASNNDTDRLVRISVSKDVSGSWAKDPGGWRYMYNDGSNPSLQWVKIDNKWYYFNSDGYAVSGWQLIDKTWYYFNSDNQMVTGWLYTGAWYYFSGSGAMQTGWASINGSWYYFEPDSGRMLKGWLQQNSTWYYLCSSGKMVTGWWKVSDTWYYFSRGGAMQYGWLWDDGHWYYLDARSGGMHTSWVLLNDTWYYLDPDNGEMVSNEVLYIGGKYQEFDSSGAWIGEVVAAGSPVYYTQRDSRWSSLVFGNWNLYSTGCVPSSLAMIFTSLKGISILPSEIATWLYNNTEEYNRRSIGGGGLCTVYASEHWGLRSKGLGSLNALQTELAAGRLVIAYQGPGLFAKAGSSHAIVLYQNSSGSTYVYDPWDSGRNGWYSISTLWGQRSTDPDDNKGGYVYYSVYN